MRKTILISKINFSIAVACIGASALLGMVLIMNVSDMENPIANMMTSTIPEELLIDAEKPPVVAAPAAPRRR